LAAARFFLRQAEAARPDREAFGYQFAAAVVFARSVVFQLKHEYGALTGYLEWHRQREELLWQDPTYRLLVDARSYILKEQPAGLSRTIDVAAGDALVAMESYLEMRVIRGRPWYRRSPRILWQDTRAALLRPLQRWRWEVGRRARAQLFQWRQRRRQGQVVVGPPRYYLTQPAGPTDRDVLDSVGEYLGMLERLIEDAEAWVRRMNGGPPNSASGSPTGGVALADQARQELEAEAHSDEE
jgi:hypothetical protein